MASWKGRDILSIRDFSRGDIEVVLKHARKGMVLGGARIAVARSCSRDEDGIDPTLMRPVERRTGAIRKRQYEGAAELASGCRG